MRKIINGKEIVYGNQLQLGTTAKFKLFDRIRILFGFQVQVFSNTYLAQQQVTVVANEVRTIVISKKQILKALAAKEARKQEQIKNVRKELTKK